MHTIGIIENDKNFRETLEDCLRWKLGHHIAFAVGSMNELLKLKNSCTLPNVILLDIHLDDSIGIDNIAEIKSIFPGVHIVVITGDFNETYILKAIQNGASSFLHKPFSTINLDTMLHNIEKTGSFLDPETLTKLMCQLSEVNTKSDPSDNLTPTEKNVLELTKKGCTYKEMATVMGVSFHTINFHLKNIYTKLDVRSKTELLGKFI